MCENCGCGGEPATPHEHGHTHTHHHEESTRSLVVQQRLLKENDAFAAANRDRFTRDGIVALNLISSPGTGKTRLLECTLSTLAAELPMAVIAGDQQTDNDARRLQDRGAPVIQIETRDACHLDAHRVGHAYDTIAAPGLRLLFIENVGNLVCPAAFDLGEHGKVALISVTEGEDKPIKYPSLFLQARAILVTKVDLLPHLEVDMDALRRNLRRINPLAQVFELSARAGTGMDAWYRWLRSLAR